MQELKTQFEEIKGVPFLEKVNRVFAGKLMAPGDIHYTSDRIHFEGKSKGKSLAATVIEIQH